MRTSSESGRPRTSTDSLSPAGKRNGLILCSGSFTPKPFVPVSSARIFFTSTRSSTQPHSPRLLSRISSTAFQLSADGSTRSCTLVSGKRGVPRISAPSAVSASVPRSP